MRFRPCCCAVRSTLLSMAKSLAPSLVRNSTDLFIFQILDAQVALGVVVNGTLRSCTNRSKNSFPLRKRTRGCGPAVGSCGPSSPAPWAAPVILQPFLRQSVESTLNPLDQRFGSFPPRPAPLRRQIGPPPQLLQLPAHFCLPESTSACSSRR